MNERRMQGFFGRYISACHPEETEVYELKFTSGKSIRFDSLKGHQREALWAAENEGVYHRIGDQPWGYNKKFRFTPKKPFDCFFARCRAYVVAWFYRPRKPKVFYQIGIGNFLKMEKSTKRKSFTEEMAREYSSGVINLK